MSDQTEKVSPFPTTEWTNIIHQVQMCDDTSAFDALSEFFDHYRDSITSFFLRHHHGCTRDRADEFTAKFFSSKVVVPWNQRHGQLDASLESDDLRSAAKFIGSLQRRERSIDAFVYKSLSDDVRVLVDKCDGERKVADGTRAAVVAGLNEIISGPCVYEPMRFEGIRLSVESSNLLQRNLDGRRTRWLNRSLLGDAFTNQILKGHGFLYVAQRQENQKFRKFLANVLWNFLKEEWERERGKKVENNSESVEDLAERGVQLEYGAYPEFERRLDAELAQEVVRRAVVRSKPSKPMQLHLQGAISQAEAAKQLDQAEGAFRVAYLRFRERLAKNIQLEVGKLVGPDKEAIKSEIKYFMSLLPDGEL